jgi:hypothetical protein
MPHRGEEKVRVLVTGEKMFLCAETDGILKFGKHDMPAGGLSKISHQKTMIFTGMAIHDAARGIPAGAINLQPLPSQGLPGIKAGTVVYQKVIHLCSLSTSFGLRRYWSK